MTSRGENALLVAVDLQRVFAEADSHWHIPLFTTLDVLITRLVERFGRRTVFTRFLPPEQPHGAWATYYREWDFVRGSGAADLFALASPWCEVARHVIDKTTFSSYGPELQRAMREADATDLVLCGVSTECCVLATALAAADDGVSVRIVRDACASVDVATHEAALRVALAGFAPIITVTTVEEEVARSTGTA